MGGGTKEESCGRVEISAKKMDLGEEGGGNLLRGSSLGKGTPPLEKNVKNPFPERGSRGGIIPFRECHPFSGGLGYREGRR